jgi:hypothetical protein
LLIQIKENGENKMTQKRVLVMVKSWLSDANKEADMLKRKGWKTEIVRGSGSHPYNIYVSGDIPKRKGSKS